jgi:hypothetical protein
MPSVVDWNHQPVDPTGLDAGQEREQSPTRDDGERWLSAALKDEWVALRKLKTPQSRRAIKIIMFYMLVEICKVPMETVCEAFSAQDHPALGLATADRYLTTAPEYLRLRLLAQDNHALDLFEPSQLLHRDLQALQQKIAKEERRGTPDAARLERWRKDETQLIACLQEIEAKEAQAGSQWLKEWEQTYRQTLAEKLEKQDRRTKRILKKTKQQRLLFG